MRLCSQCKWHVPESHYLEAWGDILAVDGTASLIQPDDRAPLFQFGLAVGSHVPLRRSPAAKKVMISSPASGKSTRRRLLPLRWNRSLKKGIVTDLPAVALFPVVPVAEVSPVADAPAPPSAAFEILFRPDTSADDGRYANNGWLQELPRPLTKLTWDNVAMISRASARSLDVKTGDVVALKTIGGSVSAPIWIQPGHADGCLSVTLGYGRTRSGEVANGVGFHAGLLRSSAQEWSLPEVRIEKLNRTPRLGFDPASLFLGRQGPHSGANAGGLQGRSSKSAGGSSRTFTAGKSLPALRI